MYLRRRTRRMLKFVFLIWIGLIFVFWGFYIVGDFYKEKNNNLITGFSEVEESKN